MKFKKYGKKIYKDLPVFYPILFICVLLYWFSTIEEINSFKNFFGALLLFLSLGFFAFGFTYNYITQPIFFEKGIKPFKRSIIPFNHINGVRVYFNRRYARYNSITFIKDNETIGEITFRSRRKAVKTFKKISEKHQSLKSKLICESNSADCLNLYKELKESEQPIKRRNNRSKKKKRKKRK